MSTYVKPLNLVKNPKGRTYSVKNLGWLWRHLSLAEVTRIRVEPYLSDEPDGAQMVTFYFTDGYLYVAAFQDWTVLLSLLQRPLFKSALVVWHNTEYNNPAECLKAKEA